MTTFSHSPGKGFTTLKGSKLSVGKRRILVFDVEARPIAFYGGDFVTKQITAICSAYVDDPEGTIRTKVLTKDDRSFGYMLRHISRRIREVRKSGDVLAGHYIRGFDLPLLNANLFHEGMELLSEVLTIDTKGNLPSMHGISKSMENLGATLGLDHGKVNMNTEKWWQANTLTKEGIEAARIRVEGDVLENIEMLTELQDRGALTPPKLWRPGTRSRGYTP